MLRQVLFIVAVVLLLRLPFLNQALQLDDVYYLAAAEYAQQHPLHPHRASYIFQGELVSMGGHPHPPWNAWFLALLRFAFGGVNPRGFHAVYILFSLLSALSIFSMARRFSPHPALATVLAVLAPPFVVDGNSLMADLPFLAWWTLAVASFLAATAQVSRAWLAVSATSLLLAGLTAYQAVFLSPLLLWWAWGRPRRWRPALVVALLPLVAVAGYQLWERLTGAPLPAAQLVANFRTYNLQSWSLKLQNALALTAHLGWLLFPLLALAAFARLPRRALMFVALASCVAMAADDHPLFWLSFGVGLCLLVSSASQCRRAWREPQGFLHLWLLGFFAFSLVIFFAGAARYLLPIAAPVAILATLALARQPRLLGAAAAAQLLLTLGLSYANYQHWNGYRRLSDSLRPLVSGQPLWINAEWGLRYYLAQLGGQPVLRNQIIPPGSWVVTSRLSWPVPLSPAGVRLEEASRTVIKPKLPLRLMGVDTPSAFTTAAFGLRPFDVSRRPADVVIVERALAVPLAYAWLPMNAPGAELQLGPGISGLEANQWRWMEQRGTLLLRSPTQPAPLTVEFTIPENAPARQLRVYLNDQLVAERRYPAPGNYTLTTPPLRSAAPRAQVTLEVDAALRPPGDFRHLGAILTAVGFKEVQQ